MPLGLHNLKSFKKKKRKRVGRGNASGHGTYSTRGIKGQRARSGGKRRPAFTLKLNQQIPKLKGFKSLKAKLAIINLEDLNRKFKSGEEITPSSLQEKDLIDNIKAGVKILGKGELKIKNLRIQGCQLSQSARRKIEERGGKIE